MLGFGNLQLQVNIATTTQEAASGIKSIESLSLRTEYKLHIYYHPVSAPVVTNSPDFPLDYSNINLCKVKRRRKSFPLRLIVFVSYQMAIKLWEEQ